MELKIIWTDFSKIELKKIFKFYKKTAGVHTAKKIVSEITKETLKLKNYPEMGQKEDLLKNDPREFRYLVYNNYKIIYLVFMDKNTVEIFDVFDTRQNPINMGRVK